MDIIWLPDAKPGRAVWRWASSMACTPATAR